jgi:hypothetical protein
MLQCTTAARSTCRNRLYCTFAGVPCCENIQMGLFHRIGDQRFDHENRPPDKQLLASRFVAATNTGS